MYRSSKRRARKKKKRKKNRKKSSDSKGGSNGWNRICRARRVRVTQTTSIPGFHGNHVTRESGQKRGVEIPKRWKRWKLAGATLKRRHGLFQVKGFQLEYLAKVPEVKDTVHKHSLLHHLCHMVMEKFPDSTDLYSEVRAAYFRAEGADKTLLGFRNRITVRHICGIAELGVVDDFLSRVWEKWSVKLCEVEDFFLLIQKVIFNWT